MPLPRGGGTDGHCGLGVSQVDVARHRHEGWGGGVGVPTGFCSSDCSKFFGSLVLPWYKKAVMTAIRFVASVPRRHSS